MTVRTTEHTAYHTVLTRAARRDGRRFARGTVYTVAGSDQSQRRSGPPGPGEDHVRFNRTTARAMAEAACIAKDPAVQGSSDLDELFAELRR